MSNFNLNNYVEVKDRIPLFYEQYEDGRITADIILQDENGITMKAYLWKNSEEQSRNTPLSTGVAREYAEGWRALPPAKEGGFILEKYTENCETSAIGRALANLNMFKGERPSREEMESAQSMADERSKRQTKTVRTKAKEKPAFIAEAEEEEQSGFYDPPVVPVDVADMYCELHGTDWFRTSKSIAHPIKDADGNELKNERNFTRWCNSPDGPFEWWQVMRNMKWDDEDVEELLKAPVEEYQNLHDLDHDDYGPVYIKCLEEAVKNKDRYLRL